MSNASDVNGMHSESCACLPPVPFIVGVPRSGTTSLRLMMDCHPLLSIPPETHFLSQLNLSSTLAPDQMIRAMLRSQRWNDFDITETDLRSLNARTASDLVRGFYRLYAARKGKKRWGDKTPRYGWNLKEIKELLPEVFFIHLIRDGRDVYASSREAGFSPIGSARHHAHMWARFLSEVSLQAELIHDYWELRYEDLVADPESCLRRICSLVQLSYDPIMLTSSRTASKRMNELTSLRLNSGAQLSKETRLSWHRKLSEATNDESVGRWRREIDPVEVERYNETAGSLLTKYGYLVAK